MTANRYFGRLKSGVWACRAKCRTWGISLVGIISTFAGWVAPGRCDTSTVWVTCATENDTMIVGVETHLTVWLDSDRDSIGNAQIAFLWTFSGPNVVGPLYDTGQSPNVAVSADAHVGFDSYAWATWLGLTASSPDSTYFNFADVLAGNGFWTGEGELFRMTFSPSNASVIQIQPSFGSQENERTIISDNNLQLLPLQFVNPTFHVVACGDANLVPGDVTLDGAVNSSDVLHIVSFVFKGGTPTAVGILSDVDCNGSTTASDIIRLVNHVFKGLGSPCDPCSLLVSLE